MKSKHDRTPARRFKLPPTTPSIHAKRQTKTKAKEPKKKPNKKLISGRRPYDPALRAPLGADLIFDVDRSQVSE